jgi:hypothetical protein
LFYRELLDRGLESRSMALSNDLEELVCPLCGEVGAPDSAGGGYSPAARSTVFVTKFLDLTDTVRSG